MYSNTYIQIKNLILTRLGYKDLVIHSDMIEVFYYNSCKPEVFHLQEPLTEEELNDLVLTLNDKAISCDGTYGNNIISEDNC